MFTGGVMECLGNVRAVVFDMDGVLWQSTAAHERAFAETFRAASLPAVPYPELAGRRTDEAFRYALARHGLEASPAQVADLTRRKQALAYRYLEESPPVTAGCRELLSALSRRFRLALATSSRAENADLFLRASGTPGLFDAVLTAADVRQAKPDPEVYRLAVARLGVAPAEAVVVEDAVSGVQAGVAVGLPVLGLLGTAPAADLLAAGARGVLDRLADLEGRLTRIVPPAAPGLAVPPGHRRAAWTAVIPAAGRGSRLGFDRPKILYPLLGRPILQWLLSLIEPLCERVVFVLSPSGKEEVVEHLARYLPGRFDVAVQEEPTGMGDAVLLTRDLVHTPNCLVVWGDQVTLSPWTLASCLRTHAAEAGTALTFPTVLRPDPYIHFRRAADARIVGVEQAREGSISVAVGENDCGVFLFNTRVLFEELARAKEGRFGRGSATGEFNLLEVIPRIDGVRTVRTVRIEDLDETCGVNTPLEARRAAAILAARARGPLAQAG